VTITSHFDDNINYHSITQFSKNATQLQYVTNSSKVTSAVTICYLIGGQPPPGQKPLGRTLPPLAVIRHPGEFFSKLAPALLTLSDPWGWVLTLNHSRKNIDVEIKILKTCFISDNKKYEKNIKKHSSTRHSLNRLGYIM